MKDFSPFTVTLSVLPWIQEIALKCNMVFPFMVDLKPCTGTIWYPLIEDEFEGDYIKIPGYKDVYTKWGEEGELVIEGRGRRVCRFQASRPLRTLGDFSSVYTAFLLFRTMSLGRFCASPYGWVFCVPSGRTVTRRPLGTRPHSRRFPTVRSLLVSSSFARSRSYVEVCSNRVGTTCFTRLINIFIASLMSLKCVIILT